MSEKLRVLVVEDSIDDAELILHELSRNGYELTAKRVDNTQTMASALTGQTWDIVLSDYAMPNFICVNALKLLQEKGQDIPFIIVSGKIGEETAVAMMKAGAHDYVMKDNLKRLFPAVQRELQEAAARKEHRQAEAALKESERRLKEAQSLGRIGNWEFDVATQKIEWSDEVYVLYERDKKSGPPTAEEEASYYSPEEVDKLHGFSRCVIEKGEEFKYDLTANLPSGKTVFFNATMHPVKDDNGRVIKLFGTVQDISERKLAEENLRRAAQEWRTTFDSISDMVSIQDRDFKIIRVNRTFAKAFKKEPQELIGKTFYDVVHSTNEPISGCLHLEALKTNKPAMVEIHNPKDNTYSEISISPILDDKAEVVATVHVIKDITMRKKAQEELQLKAQLLDAATDAIIMRSFDDGPKAKILYLNEAATKIFGYSRDEFLNMSMRDLYPWSSPNLTETRRKQLEETGENSFELFARCKDGARMPVESHSKLVSIGDRRFVLSVIRDITERKQAEWALRESEVKYRMMIENLPVGIAITAYDGRPIERNRASMEMHGYSSLEEYEKIPPANLYVDIKERDRLLKAIENGPVRNFETRHLRKDGSTFWISMTAMPQTGENREKLLLVVSQDIDERKRAEEALKASEEKFRSLVENAPVGITLTKLDGSPTERNRASMEMYGYDSKKEFDKVRGNDLYIDPADRARFVELTAKGPVRNFEVRRKRRDGSVFWTSSSSIPVMDESGIRQLIVITEDTTQRRQAAEALRASEEKFRSLVENAPVGIGITTLDGRPLWRNKAVARMFGFKDVEEFMANSITTRYNHPEDRKRFLELVSKGMVKDFEVLLKRKDGTPFWASVTAIPETTVAGEKQFITIIQDINESKKAKEELQQNYETETVLNQLLTLSLGNIPINELLQKALSLIISVPSFSLESKGCIFLTDNQSDVLTMAAQIGLAKPLLEKCKRVPFGKCICGLAASSQKTEFVDRIEGHHEIQYNGTAPHGHYAIPILLNSRTVGVINTYVKEGHTKNIKEEQFLINVANVLAGIIVRKQSQENLRASEAKFRNLIENAPVGVSITAESGQVVLRNAAIQKMHGYQSWEEFMKTPADDFYYDVADRKRFLSLAARGPVKDFEVRRRRHDGSVFWISLTSIPNRTVSGENQVLVISQDIDERKKSEEALQVSEERFRNLVENLPVGIGVSTVDGHSVQRNKALMEMYGFADRREFDNSSTPGRYYDIKDRTRFVELAEKGPLKGFEVRLKRRDGTVFWTSMNAIKQTTPSGEKQFVTVIQDIDDKKKSEAENALKALLLDSAGDMILLRDMTGKILYINNAACKSYGYTKEEAKEMNIRDLLPPGRPVGPSLRNEELLKKGEARFETAHVCKDGTEIPLEVYHRLIKLGEDFAVISIERDISERQRMQEQLMIADRLASVGQLASGVAHEVNNPLTSVIGFSELLLERPLPDDIKEDLTTIRTEAQRAAGIIRNLLTFARKNPPSRQPVNLNDVIKKVLELRAYEENINNITVIDRLAPDLEPVMADSSQLQQVFFNIVTNAEYFMIESHHKGTLTITTENAGNVVRASFTDDGPGMSIENLDHLFTPFFTTKPVGKGTGLGLSICHGIIASHEGKIYAESTPGAGATFIVEIPAGLLDVNTGDG